MKRATVVVRRTVLLLSLGAVAAGDLTAQANFPRPRLHAGQDTNDAGAYLQNARNLLTLSTDSAHAAAEASLVWAGRLDPGSGDVPYLLTVAVFRPIVVQARRGGLSRGYLREELTPARMHYADSLMREAWFREPFYDLELEPLLCTNLVPPKRVRDPASRGYFAYQFHDSRLALDSWAEALARDSSLVELRLHRAHTFYWMEQYDSSIAELHAVLASVERPDTNLQPVLRPTYVLEYRLAVAEERAGRADSAIAAYHEALDDNLGLYMARVRVSNLLFAAGDTTKALNEIALAMDIAPGQPWLATYYGYLLLEGHRASDAADQLNAAIALDSVYSTPYFLLGMAESVLGRDSLALAHFEMYLRRAAQADGRRDWTKQRVAALRAELTAPARPRE